MKCVDTAIIPSPTCADTGSGVITSTVAVGTVPLAATLTNVATGTTLQCFAIANNGVTPGDVCSTASNSVTVTGPPTAPTIGTPVSTSTGALTVPFTASTE